MGTQGCEAGDAVSSSLTKVLAAVDQEENAGN